MRSLPTRPEVFTGNLGKRAGRQRDCTGRAAVHGWLVVGLKTCERGAAAASAASRRPRATGAGTGQVPASLPRKAARCFPRRNIRGRSHASQYARAILVRQEDERNATLVL